MIDVVEGVDRGVDRFVCREDVGGRLVIYSQAG